jgi:hypothetical protein
MSRNPDIQPEPLDRERRWIVDLTHTCFRDSKSRVKGVKTLPESQKVESQDLIRTVDCQRDLDCGIQVAGPSWIRIFGKWWGVVRGFTETRDPDAFLGVDPRFRAKGHVNKRAKKTLYSVFWVFGFRGSKNQSSLQQES